MKNILMVLLMIAGLIPFIYKVSCAEAPQYADDSVEETKNWKDWSEKKHPQEEAGKQRKQKELAKLSYADELLVNGKLTLPTTKRLLQMAGYSNKAPIKIFCSTLSLKNQLGYTALDSYYFIFAKQSTTEIEKIAVIIYNHDDYRNTVLLTFAPVLLFKKISPHGDVAFVNYFPIEYSSRPDKQEYLVYPDKVGCYVFNYGGEYKANESAFKTNLNYAEICTLILKETDDLYGKGKAQLIVEDGRDRAKFHLTDIECIYP